MGNPLIVIEVEIPAKDNKPKKTAHLEVRFGKFMMNPSKNNIRYKTEELSNTNSHYTKDG